MQNKLINQSLLVSVIMPTYNREAYISEAINSVLTQTYPTLELIIIDDGSTDGTQSIVSKHAANDSRIKYLYKENGGQASARNLGIKSAQGEIIAFLDSDDIWINTKLEIQFLNWDFSSVDMVYTLGFYLNENGDSKSIVPYKWVTGSFSGEMFLNILLTSNTTNTGTVLLKKNIFEKIGFFNENQILRGTEDFDLWLRIADSGFNVLGLPDRTVYYRIHGSNVHHDIISQSIGKVTALKQLIGNKKINNAMLLKQFRFFYRELHLKLFEQKDLISYKKYSEEYLQIDSKGTVARIQSVLLNRVSIRLYHYISKYMILPIGFRIESISYKK